MARQRLLLGVRGMDTPDGALLVSETLQAVEGVYSVEADTDGQAAVEYDATQLTAMDLIRALRRVGFLAGME
ncbi:MAG TPA: cation transporter [Deinococcales bacterium]|nr:cation transporter [Deinococcales bacterium]